MDKKEIQRQRMMKYFIEAAKKIIREKGVKNVTVRKVADLAGYSYATLYNYFKDLDELLYYCISDFLDECCEYVQSTTEQPESQVLHFKSHITKYVEYFINNPNIFQAIFVEDLKSQPPEEVKLKLNKPSAGVLLGQMLMGMAQSNYIVQKDVNVLTDLIFNFIHGKLLFYIKRTHEKRSEEFVRSVEEGVDYLLLKGRKVDGK